MYDGVGTDKDNHEFDVPKDRLEMILNCYNTQLLGVVRTKRKSYSSLNYNKLLHALKEISYLKVVFALRETLAVS